MILGLSPLQLSLAALLPLVISLALGGWTIQVLRSLKAGQRVRDDGPQRHLQKEGTPTMGGVLLIGALLLGAVASCLAAFGWLPFKSSWSSASPSPWAPSASRMITSRSNTAVLWPQGPRKTPLAIHRRHYLRPPSRYAKAPRLGPRR